MSERSKQIVARLNRNVLITAGELMEEFNIGRAAAFRYLKKENMCSSINFRGQYHIKFSKLKFNRYGLASFDDKVFSKHGNLIETITQLVNRSADGMPVSELNRLTGTKTHMQCGQLARDRKVFRKKFHGQYYYFSMDKEARNCQLKRREPAPRAFDMDALVKSESTESLGDVIKVLVTYINNPGFSPKSVALSLIRRGYDIQTKRVQDILERYGIAKKKP
jgi:hypothetical protein